MPPASPRPLWKSALIYGLVAAGIVLAAVVAVVALGGDVAVQERPGVIAEDLFVALDQKHTGLPAPMAHRHGDQRVVESGADEREIVHLWLPWGDWESAVHRIYRSR